MTKQQLIVWIRNYIKADQAYNSKRCTADQAKTYAQKFQKPLQKEEKTGVIGSIFTGIFVAIIGAIPVGFVSAVIWVIWDFIEMFKVDLKHNPGAEMLSTKIVESAAGLVIDDVNTYFNQHEVLGPAIAFLIIGLAISAVIGFIFIIVSIISDKGVPKRNKEHAKEYENNQKLLAAAQVVYDLKKKEADIAWKTVERLQKESPVPKDYLPWAEKILRILENQRADTLKEAINVLHTDWHRQDQLEEIKRHNEAVERQNAQTAAALSRSADAADRAADRAAEAANEAAYWERQRYFDDLLK